MINMWLIYNNRWLIYDEYMINIHYIYINVNVIIDKQYQLLSLCIMIIYVSKQCDTKYGFHDVSKHIALQYIYIFEGFGD